MSEKQQLPQSDHDLLIETNTVVRRLDKWCENHTAHHLQYAIMAWAATIGLTVALILELLKK